MSTNYVGKIKPLDAFAEWFIKGNNLGFYIGIFMSKVEKQTGFFQRAVYTSKTMLTLGISAGTWFFFSKFLERIRGVDDGLNYGLGIMAMQLILHRLWGIPTQKLGRNLLMVGLLGTALGEFCLKQHI